MPTSLRRFAVLAGAVLGGLALGLATPSAGSSATHEEVLVRAAAATEAIDALVEATSTTAGAVSPPTPAPAEASTTAATAAPTTTSSSTTTEAPTTATTEAPTTTEAPPPSTTTTAAPPPAPAPAPEPEPAPPASAAEAAIRHWFGDVYEKAADVAWCESRHDPRAVSAGGGNHGLFQINTVHRAEFEAVTGRSWDDAIYDADANAQYARALYDREGWAPWACG